MRVHLVRKESIEEFVLQNASARIGFQQWLTRVKFADWYIPEDMKAAFPGTDLLGNGSARVVFNIGGNKYRIICKYLFGESQVHLFVCWIGSHAEYDRVCKAGRQYSVKNY